MTTAEWVLVIVLLGFHVEKIPMASKEACFNAVLAVASIEDADGDPFRLSFCMNAKDGTVVR